MYKNWDDLTHEQQEVLLNGKPLTHKLIAYWNDLTQFEQNLSLNTAYHIKQIQDSNAATLERARRDMK